MQATEIHLTGKLGAASLAGWVSHRARLLDLRGWMERSGPEDACIIVIGEAAMIEAMEVSCSLGPADVLVTEVSTGTRQISQAPDGFFIR